VPFIFEQDDFRFHRIQEATETQSNAVIFAMRDISGSMGAEKKYLSRALLFWLVEYLRHLYEKVEIRFIVHHTEARMVNEEDFFKLGESGGTYCASAFELANNLIDAEYPPNAWNIYAFLFSDGDDFDPNRTVAEIGKMLAKGVNMVGYAKVGISYSGDPLDKMSSLLTALKEAFPLERSSIAGGLGILRGERDFPLLCAVVQGKDHILPVLREFLRKERWRHE